MRTLSGEFAFVGYSGTTLVSAARIPAVVVVKSNNAPPNVLSSGVVQQVVVGVVTGGVTFKVWIRNAGPNPAEGCHARSKEFSRLKTTWQRFDPGTGNPIGAVNSPTTIPAGGAYWFNVVVRSQELWFADPTLLNEIVLDCANTAPVPFTARNRFDLSAVLNVSTAGIYAAIAPPTGSFINVPAGSFAAFNVKALNQRSAATLVVRPRYERPYTDTNPNSYFSALICQTASVSGACLATPAANVQYSAPVNSTKTFRVFVYAPAVNPGFDPDNRRIFVDFKQTPPADAGFNENIMVGTTSIAVRRN